MYDRRCLDDGNTAEEVEEIIAFYRAQTKEARAQYRVIFFRDLCEDEYQCILKELSAQLAMIREAEWSCPL